MGKSNVIIYILFVIISSVYIHYIYIIFYSRMLQTVLKSVKYNLFKFLIEKVYILLETYICPIYVYK